jgi:transcriptional regulator with XRE-family HTH domain
MTIIGSKIKEQRQALKMSQRELAKRVGYLDHSTVARIENGKVDLPQSKIAIFADALGVTPGHLMGWDAEPEDLGAVAADVLGDPALLSMVQDYLELSESDQFMVRTLVESLASKTKKD